MSIVAILFRKIDNLSSLLYSGLSRVSMDPRNKSEDDKIERVSEDDKIERVSEDNCYKKNESKDDQRECVFENDFTLRSSFRGGAFLLSLHRGDRRGQAIYELNKKANRKIPGIFLQSRKIGMTLMLLIGMTISLFFMFLFLFVLVSFSSHAATCFLPDCQNEEGIMRFIPEGAYECLAKGYKPTPEISCPPYSLIDECPENDYYIKCNQEKWCLENGYVIGSCSVPQYIDEQCPNGLELYKYCTPNYYKACSELNAEYVAECESGWAHDTTAYCPYSNDYAKCCNTCIGYDYVLSDIGVGYIAGESCSACNNVTKYKRELAPCDGYQMCNNGAKSGASSCMHGTEMWYSACCEDTYKYTCKGTGYAKGSGTACGGKYKSCNCSTQYKWSSGTCKYCGSSYKYACTSGSNVTGGSGTACGGRYTACTCGSGYEWKNGTCESSCGSSYIYICSGTGYNGGNGTSCNGRYDSCSCKWGYKWDGSACVESPCAGVTGVSSAFCDAMCAKVTNNCDNYTMLTKSEAEARCVAELEEYGCSPDNVSFMYQCGSDEDGITFMSCRPN